MVGRRLGARAVATRDSTGHGDCVVVLSEKGDVQNDVMQHDKTNLIRIYLQLSYSIGYTDERTSIEIIIVKICPKLEQLRNSYTIPYTAAS